MSTVASRTKRRRSKKVSYRHSKEYLVKELAQNSKQLWAAAKDGKADELERCLNKHVIDPNYCDNFGGTAIGIASCRGHVECVRILLADNRIDPTIKANLGQDAILSAAQSGRLEVLKLLIKDPRVDINSYNCERLTPLIDAAREGHVEVVKLLVDDPRTKVNWVSKSNLSALVAAAEQGHLEIVRMLLDHPEVDPNCCTNDGINALIYAAGEGHTEVVQLLLEDVRVKCNEIGNNWSALGLAVHFNFEDTVKALLNCYYVDVDMPDKRNGVPFETAVKMGASHKKIVKAFEDWADCMAVQHTLLTEMIKKEVGILPPSLLLIVRDQYLGGLRTFAGSRSSQKELAEPMLYVA